MSSAVPMSPMTADREALRKAKLRQSVKRAISTMEEILGRPIAQDGAQDQGRFFEDIGDGIMLCDAANRIGVKHFGKARSKRQALVKSVKSLVC